LLAAFQGDRLQAIIDVLAGGQPVAPPPLRNNGSEATNKRAGFQFPPLAENKPRRPKKTYPDSARYVRSVGEAAGFSRQQLAEALGCTVRRVRDLQNGQTRPTPEQAEVLRGIEASALQTR
jgi:ribosome-binding protein aMBF1 (putative translation factor)